MGRASWIVAVMALFGVSLPTEAQRGPVCKPPPLGQLARRGFAVESATGTAPQGLRGSIVFGDDGFGLHASCRVNSGSAALRGGRLHISGATETLTGCVNDSHARDAAWLMEFLTRAPRVRFRDGQLILNARGFSKVVLREVVTPHNHFVERDRRRNAMAPDTPWGPNPVPCVTPGHAKRAK